eukprot:289858-Rhodomonas_salina.1
MKAPRHSAGWQLRRRVRALVLGHTHRSRPSGWLRRAHGTHASGASRAYDLMWVVLCNWVGCEGCLDDSDWVCVARTMVRCVWMCFVEWSAALRLWNTRQELAELVSSLAHEPRLIRAPAHAAHEP